MKTYTVYTLYVNCLLYQLTIYTFQTQIVARKLLTLPFIIWKKNEKIYKPDLSNAQSDQTSGFEEAISLYKSQKTTRFPSKRKFNKENSFCTTNLALICKGLVKKQTLYRNNRVGHWVFFRSERIVLLCSFKECNILLHSFFEFLATYETQKNDAFFS